MTRGENLTEKISQETIKGSLQACLLIENNYFLKRLTTSLKSWKQSRELNQRLTGTGRIDWNHKFQWGHRWEPIPSQVKTWSPWKGTWTASMTKTTMNWPWQLQHLSSHNRYQPGEHGSQHPTSASIQPTAPENPLQRYEGPSLEARTCLRN